VTGRRGFVVGVLTLLAAAPGAAWAQAPERLRRIAYLSMAPGPSPRSEALQQALQDLGYIEGRTATIEYRWADGQADRGRAAAQELARSGVDVIVTGGPQATRQAREATGTIPIVMAFDYDPVAAGFVASLARPGGNVTGLSSNNPLLSGKRLQLLKEVVPRVTRIAILWNPDEPNSEAALRETQMAARALGIRVQPLAVRSPDDLEGLLLAAIREQASALTVPGDPVTLFHRATLASLALKHRLPTIYNDKLLVEAGGLMSYGASDRELHRRAAVYVDRILKGAKPADLPVEQPTKFELVINRKTAKTLGLTIPPSVLARADEVIQ
jgi:putative tryptophan/tyrosine transport system substrate-binding protein